MAMSRYLGLAGDGDLADFEVDCARVTTNQDSFGGPW
jgi:hypothetical protein